MLQSSRLELRNGKTSITGYLPHAVRCPDHVELHYRKEASLRGELKRLTVAENQCCDVEGVRFEFEENDEHYVMYVIAPEHAAESVAVRTVLENFADMPNRA